MKTLFFIILIIHASCLCYAQTATVFGVIKDTEGETIPGVQVAVLEDASKVTTTDANGKYELTIPANKEVTLSVFNINFKQINKKITLKTDERFNYNPFIVFKNQIGEVQIIEENRTAELYRVDPKLIRYIPGGSGNLEDIIKTQIGVTSNNELSSGYSVRGGNFDENLVYVNDIEVYRPFLTRSGQQEGLSFANPDMVSNIHFSAGGFEAKYGDKLSSVLDITYRKPTKFGGTVSGSLLGGNIHLEGVSKNRLLSWSVGSRYKTNSYLLKQLDTKGDYRPRFYDVQTLLTFAVNEKLTVEFLGNIANNKYLVIPANRETTFGTVQKAYSFKVFFDGQELMQYTTMLGGLSTTYKPNNTTKLKFIASAYNTQEEEKYTVQGQYFIDQLETDFGKSSFGQTAFNLGIGTFLNNGRNKLNASVYTIEHKGTHYLKSKNQVLWGIRYQYESITDKLSEWRTVDSAGYINPYSPNDISLIDVIKTKINVQSNRVMGYGEYVYSKELNDSSELTVTAGVRGNYWSLNNQLVVSPRVTTTYRPNWKRDFVFKLSCGVYNQPPFYRELRGFDGKLNTQIKSQQSIHYVLSSDYNFQLWKRPFKFIVSAYYKQFSNLIPYEIDNVRIRYYAQNNAVGYARGIDFRINGEFLKGMESWASVGILSTKEYSSSNVHYMYFNSSGDTIVPGYTFDTKAVDSSRIDPGYIPRPTDQLVTFGLFFQDYLPMLPDCKMYLSTLFGTGLPYGPPNHQRWQQVFKMPSYRRVDIGFAYQIIKEDKELPKQNPFHHFKAMWLSLEVLNLLQVNNTISYTWVEDVTGRQYAIPNYLTNRQLNLKLQIKF